MAALCVAVAAGLVAVVLWGGLDIATPWAGEISENPLPAREVLRRYVWYLSITVAAGVGAGLVMIGAGGRLAMRLLAVTAGDAAQGRITEADQIVGEITLDGTIGFIAFFGIFGGLMTGALYVLIYRWLPRGRWAGITYGALLLVLFATRIEPLRADNPDFDIVGPGSLSVAVYVVLGLAHAMLAAAIAARYSRALPLISKNSKAIAAHAPLIVLGLAFPVLIPVAIVGVLAVALSRVRALRAFIASPRAEMGGRVLGLIFFSAALPGFVSAVIDIAGRT